MTTKTTDILTALEVDDAIRAATDDAHGIDSVANVSLVFRDRQVSSTGGEQWVLIAKGTFGAVDLKSFPWTNQGAFQGEEYGLLVADALRVDFVDANGGGLIWV